MSHELNTFDALLAHIAALAAPSNGVSIAFSGGLDSRFLAHAAIKALGSEHVELLHVQGPHTAQAESTWAKDWAERQGLRLVTLHLDPLQLPEVAKGDKMRCYACKKHLFTHLLKKARYILCDGSNASDARLFRPGAKAVQELGIRSPLAACGLEKEELRILGRLTDFERPNQPARPCLLTRLPYGIEPSVERLERLATLEARTEVLLRAMAPEQEECWDFRVRLAHETPDSFTVHVGHPLTRQQRDLLHESLSTLAPCTVESTAQVSGYFDAKSVLP